MHPDLHTAIHDPLLAAAVGRIFERSGTEQQPSVRWMEMYGQQERKRFVVPIVGIQGAGKSTLLNAMLFERPVLPIEADETTAVPVEIVYAEKPSDTAQIIYHNGGVITCPADERELAKYVDHSHNRNNQLGVNRVIIESRADILRNGIVLVDLPGLGSLSESNRETSMAYMKTAAGMIYLLRTVPPLTRSESIALALVWSTVPVAFFAQNQWTDETPDEARSALEYNRDQVRSVAQKARISLEKNGPQIHAVCIYKAWQARLQDNRNMAHESKLPAFTDYFYQATQNWQSLIETGILETVICDLNVALSMAQEQKADLELRQADARRRLDTEINARRAGIETINQKVGDITEAISAFKQEQSRFLMTWKRNERSELRNRVRTLLRKGIVDGSRLDLALADYQNDSFDTLTEAIHEAVWHLHAIVSRDLTDIDCWHTPLASTGRLEKPESIKVENLLAPAGGVAGTITGAQAGVALGAAISSALSTAKSAAVAGAAGGPVVAGICACAGAVLGGLLGAYLGQKGRQVATRARAWWNESEVFAIVDTFLDDSQVIFKNAIASYTSQLSSVLNQWQNGEKRACEQAYAKRSAAINASDDARAAGLNDLNRDMKLIHAWKTRLEAQ